jgi:hypothetical protein
MLNVQLAKDTFYTALRDRIAAGNAARTVVVRGTIRPGVVVAENELPGAAVDGIAPADAFCLRWTELRIDTQGPLPLVALTCEIRFATDGSAGNAGMDRGRALATMDAELMTAISTTPQSAGSSGIQEIAGGGAATVTVTGTNVFWGDASFKPATMRGERMERIAEVEVFSYGQ